MSQTHPLDSSALLSPYKSFFCPGGFNRFSDYVFRSDDGLNEIVLFRPVLAFFFLGLLSGLQIWFAFFPHHKFFLFFFFSFVLPPSLPQPETDTCQVSPACRRVSHCRPLVQTVTLFCRFGGHRKRVGVPSTGGVTNSQKQTTESLMVPDAVVH